MPITTTTQQVKYDLGDVNNDGYIDAVDASTVLSYYAKVSTNADGGFTDSQKEVADVNHDGFINAVDASNILAYYAYLSTGGTIEFADYLANPPVTTTKATTTIITSTTTTSSTTTNITTKLTPFNGVIYDQDGIVVKYNGISDNKSSSGEKNDQKRINLYIENNTDTDIIFQIRNLSINGFMVSGNMYSHVAMNKKINDCISIYNTELNKNSITDIENIEFRLHVVEENTLKTYKDTEPIIIIESIADTKTFIGANYAMKIPVQWKQSFPLMHDYSNDEAITVFTFYNHENEPLLLYHDCFVDNSISEEALLSIFYEAQSENDNILNIEYRKTGDITYLYSTFKDNNVSYTVAFKGGVYGFTTLNQNLVPDYQELIEHIIHTVMANTEQIEVKNNESFNSLTDAEKKGLVGLIMFLNKYFTYSDTAHIVKCSSSTTGHYFYELEYTNVEKEKCTETFLYSITTNKGLRTTDMPDENYQKITAGLSFNELNAAKMDAALQLYYKS